jgi:hypothetical protein
VNDLVTFIAQRAVLRQRDGLDRERTRILLLVVANDVGQLAVKSFLERMDAKSKSMTSGAKPIAAPAANVLPAFAYARGTFPGPTTKAAQTSAKFLTIT